MAEGRVSHPNECARWLENPYYQFFCDEESFPAWAAVRAILADALAPAARRGAAGGLASGEPVGGAQERRAGEEGPGARGGGHNRAGQDRGLPRPAFAEAKPRLRAGRWLAVTPTPSSSSATTGSSGSCVPASAG
jgi:hypothetical protein